MYPTVILHSIHALNEALIKLGWNYLPETQDSVASLRLWLIHLWILNTQYTELDLDMVLNKSC